MGPSAKSAPETRGLLRPLPTQERALAPMTRRKQFQLVKADVQGLPRPALALKYSLLPYI